MNNHPQFAINGVNLTPAQCSVVWTALQSFSIEMQNPLALGDDEHGRTMVKLYRKRVNEINQIALDTTP